MKPRRWLPITGLIIGTILALGPFFGVLATMFGMSRVFGKTAGQGISDPKAFSDELGETLVYTAGGILLLPVGVVLIGISLYFLLRETTPVPPPLPAQTAPGSAQDDPGARRE